MASFEIWVTVCKKTIPGEYVFGIWMLCLLCMFLVTGFLDIHFESICKIRFWIIVGCQFDYNIGFSITPWLYVPPYTTLQLQHFLRSFLLCKCNHYSVVPNVNQPINKIKAV